MRSWSDRAGVRGGPSLPRPAANLRRPLQTISTWSLPAVQVIQNVETLSLYWIYKQWFFNNTKSTATSEKNHIGNICYCLHAFIILGLLISLYIQYFKELLSRDLDNLLYIITGIFNVMCPAEITFFLSQIEPCLVLKPSIAFQAILRFSKQSIQS